MALTLVLDGNINLQLTDEARPIPVPLRFNLSYTQKVLYDFDFSGAAANVAVPQGSLTAPKAILVFVREGSLSLSWSATGEGPTVLTANPSPPPADVPTLLLFRFQPGAGQLYTTVAAAARGSIWLFS